MSRSSRPRALRWLAIAGLSAWLLLPSQAFAQPESHTKATAVALFDEARQLMKEGRHEEACPKLEESQRLDPGIGTLYNLADCYEKTGRTASAWLRFREVVAQSSRAGQTERAVAARQRVDEVAPRLCRVRIEIRDAAPDLSVELDGAPASSATWGTAVPVDPGKHVVRASAPGHRPWESSLEVNKEGETVTFAVPRLESDGAAPAPVVAAPPPSPSDASPDEPPAPSDSSSTPWQVPVGIAAMGVGVVALAVGTGVGFAAKSSADDADCDADNDCSQAGVDDRDSAVAQGNIATVVFVAGGVLTVGGVVLWLTAPSSDEPSDASRSALAVGLAPRPGGASIVGRF